MKSPSTFSATACLLSVVLAAGALPASAVERVPSEPSRTPKALSVPQWKLEGFPAARVARMEYREMPVARILRVQQYNATRQMKPTQIGIGRIASSEGKSRALPALQWTTLRDGGSVARVEIGSPVALGLRVGLKVGRLDPRAELRFAGSDDPSRVVAVMTGNEVRKLTDARGVFWTPSTDGEKQLIEISLPAGVFPSTVGLQAPELSHLLTNSANDFKIIEKIGESGSCNVDTACRVAELGADFVSAKNAVAHMNFNLYNSNGTVYGSFICTGTLLADTVQASQIPYFYTAHHCFAGGVNGAPVQTDLQKVANSLNTYWKYEATACGSGVQAAKVLLGGGSDYLYSNASTDGMFLRLKNAPPAGSEFSGWDSGVLAPSANIIGIHHPSGDAKKVSSGQRLTQDSTHNEVGWLSGTTEGGSSGSGLFTADPDGYHLRGGLHGGNASCANTGSLTNPDNWDVYSRFDVVYPHISQWLSPTSVNVAPVANYTYSVNGKIISFTDTSTDSDGTIASRSWSFGDGTTSTAANPVKTYASLGVYNVTLTVTDNGGLSHSVTRSVSTIGRQRVHGSQPRVPPSAAGSAAPPPAPSAAPSRIRKIPPMGPFEP